MLLAGALPGHSKDIDFRYFLLRKTMLMHAPHLFANDSALFLLTCVLQKPATVASLLEHAGLNLKEGINIKVARLLQDLETKRQGAGYTTVYGELQEQLQNMWESSEVAYYAGYYKAGTYSSVANKPLAELPNWGKEESFHRKDRRMEEGGGL